MSCHKYVLYVGLEEKQSRVDISPDPNLDLSFYLSTGRPIKILQISPPLPIGVAHYLKTKVLRAGLRGNKTGGLLAHIPFWGHGKNPRGVSDKLSFVRTELERIGYNGLDSPKTFAIDSYNLAKIPTENDLVEVNNTLTGRLLFEDEIERALVEQGRFLESPLEKVLQVLYLRGEVERLPGVGLLNPSELQCYRCGEGKNLFPGECSFSPAPCYYCEECVLMSASKLCRPLYGRPRSAYAGLFSGVYADTTTDKPEKSEVLLDFELTPAQKDAAATLEAFIGSGTGEELLVWAVCGAGKTEVSFDAIARALSLGAKVLYAVPRRDVVLELYPRFKKAFPKVSISVLYGGSRSGRFDDAQLTLATTHQVIRFYRNFDLVVLDEVDAFPYRGSRMLYDAVTRARVPGGKTFYLTATPRPEYLRRVREGKIVPVTIPARHHGFPLPVPEIVKTHSLKKKGGGFGVSDVVKEFLHACIEGAKAQVFVFVPAVSLVKKVADTLQREVRLPPFSNWDGDWVRGSHARDPDRDAKRESFSRGDFPIFVTTSIMERGITVPNANVLVLFADYERIYDVGTLVQMAGRSGRTTDYPRGSVLYVGAKITPAMRGAVEQITYMNEEARRKGYLQDCREGVAGND